MPFRQPAVDIMANKLLGAFHQNCVINKTIVLKDSFLMTKSIDVIGTIIHEIGHAFNVAAKIPNSEANAYIFEIEVMLKLLETDNPMLFGNFEKEQPYLVKTWVSVDLKSSTLKKYE